MRMIILAAAALLAGCANSGTALVTGATRAATTPDAVRIYLEPPAQYEVIGSVQDTARLGVSAQHNLNKAIAGVRERAAAMGANGIILDYQGVPGGAPPTVITGSNGVFAAIPTGDGGDREVRGRAIYVAAP